MISENANSSLSLRTQAEALRLALAIGAVDVEGVVAWAISKIDPNGPTHWSIGELASSSKRYPPGLDEYLAAVSGEPDVEAARRALLAFLEESLRKQPSQADKIAEALYQLAYSEDLTGPMKTVAWWAWDALSLADAGYTKETRADVIEAMLQAFEEARRSAPG